MFIEEDTHVFENGYHKMNLKLSYEKTSGTTSGGTGENKSTKYTVVANSGLNLRSAPNANIIATMPKGTIVTADGENKDGWYHVEYNGTWGYA